jgi:hypothetical protein
MIFASEIVVKGAAVPSALGECRSGKAAIYFQSYFW